MIHRVGRAERDAAVATLAAAFTDDVMLRILEPADWRRARVARWFFGCIIDFALRWAQVWANEDVSAVGIWVPPGSAMTTARMLRVGIANLPLKVGLRGTLRLISANAALDRMHHATVRGPHWYMPAVGVRPEARGRGHFGEILGIGLKSADAGRLPCYGEATSEFSAGLAGRIGFVMKEERVIGGFTFRAILRPPQAAGSTGSG